MRGRDIADKLRVTYQRVHQLAIRLHAQGHVTFGDPENPLWMVMRAGDKTPLLSLDEERVLSAIPSEYATNAAKIRLAAHMSEDEAHKALERLIAGGFVEACEGFQGHRLYRITAAGLKHPQRDQAARRAQAPRLPADSERIRNVLSAISDSGTLRIKDVADAVGVAHQSINSLIQYLKRKQLVKKNRSGTRCTVFVDGRRACCLGGNDTPTCRIVMLPLACPLFVGLPMNGRNEAAAFHM
jgi:DNA-binding MarR family transcriptional regulator